MAKTVEFKTLDDVHKAFVCWESQGNAEEFARTLLQTAAHVVGESKGKIYDKDRLAREVFLTLLEYGSLAACLTDDFRRLVIRYHARGLSTTSAIQAILGDDSMRDITPFWLLKYRYACGKENIKNFLVSRLSYLKPSHPRWPEKKFGAFWRAERAAYVDVIKDIPLTQPQEQLSRLSEHYTDLEMQYQNAERATDKERFHKCMVRTIAAIHQLTRGPCLTSQEQPVSVGAEPTQPALQSPQQDIIDIPAEKTTVANS